MLFPFADKLVGRIKLRVNLKSVWQRTFQSDLNDQRSLRSSASATFTVSKPAALYAPYEAVSKTLVRIHQSLS
jgi:hypothetical protein